MKNERSSEKTKIVSINFKNIALGKAMRKKTLPNLHLISNYEIPAKTLAYFFLLFSKNIKIFGFKMKRYS